MTTLVDKAQAHRFRFRAWDTKCKKMFSAMGDGFEVYRMCLLDDGLYWIDQNGTPFRNERLKDIILMQSTGLTDKNGKEIFEGDVLSYKQNDTAKKVVEQHEVVRFGEFSAGFDWSEYSGLGFYVEKVRVIRDGLDETRIWPRYSHIAGLTSLLSFQRCEVIGNIYEHSHLLKKA